MRIECLAAVHGCKCGQLDWPGAAHGKMPAMHVPCPAAAAKATCGAQGRALSCVPSVLHPCRSYATAEGNCGNCELSLRCGMATNEHGSVSCLHRRQQVTLLQLPLLSSFAAAPALLTAGPDENAAHCTTLNGTTIDCNPQSTLIDGACLSCGESHELQWLAP